MNDDPLKISGPPRRLRLYSELICQQTDVHLVASEAIAGFSKGDSLPYRFKKFNLGQPADLRLRLPNNTKPGKYNAKLEADKRTYDVQIEIEPQVKLKHTPKQLSFVGKAGTKITQTILFENQGNVPIRIPKEGLANIYRLSGIPEALSSTLQLDSDNATEIASNLLLTLKNGYSGLLKMRFTGKQTDILPGQCCTYILDTRLPKPLESSEFYFGLLHLNEFHFLISVRAI